MNAVILCAGFATRMYPLTRTFPKPLLEVAGKPVLDYLMEQILTLRGIEGVHIVTNALFYHHFERWRQIRETSGTWGGLAVTIHNDGCTANENRLGAAADLLLALEALGGEDRMLVSGGDNIYLFALPPLWERFLRRKTHCIPALEETELHKLQKTGVLEIGPDDRLLRLHEKPDRPPSNWTCPPLYFFEPTVGAILAQFLRRPGNHDAPGYFIDYLCRQEPVHVFRVPAGRLDIGSIDSYREADRLLRSQPIP